MGKNLGIPGEYFALANDDEMVFRVIADLPDGAVFRRNGEWIDLTPDEMVDATIIGVEPGAVDVFDQYEQAGRLGHLSQYPISPGQTRFWEVDQDPRITDAFTTADLAIAVAAAVGGPHAPRQAGALLWGEAVLDALESVLGTGVGRVHHTVLLAAIRCRTSPVSPFWGRQDNSGLRTLQSAMDRYGPVLQKIEDERNAVLDDFIREFQDHVGRALEGVTWAELELRGATRRPEVPPRRPAPGASARPAKKAAPTKADAAKTTPPKAPAKKAPAKKAVPRKAVPRKAVPRKADANRAAHQALPPALAALVPHLAEALRRLDDDTHLVIGIHSSVRYLQFATFRPNLRLETIGTRYLELDGDTMPVDHLVWLADRGWHDADDGGNLWREWIPSDEDEAAAVAVEVLVKVHGVTDIEQIWFQSEDDDALAALDGYSPPARPASLQPTSPVRAAAINAAVLGEPLRLPSGSKVVAVVDYNARDAVLEVLALIGGEVLRRHDGGWHEDPQWRMVFRNAPSRSIVPLTQQQFEKVLVQVDRSTAGKPWKPFKVSHHDHYWPSSRPNDPDLFDWSQLDSLDDLHEP